MTDAGHAHHDLPVTTALELPGKHIVTNLGPCFGLVVRSMGLSRSFAVE